MFLYSFSVGKKASCGVIALYCLNLPSELRYRPENIFIVGFTPPPNTPTFETLCHLLTPVLSALLKYGTETGQIISTFYHADGISIKIKVAPLLADSPARVEVAGFLGHAAKCLCAFCNCTKDDLDNLDLTSWVLKNGTQVRIDGEYWRSLTTKSAREKYAMETGVRWSSLYILPYWDPVRHMVLGFMHNWLEGILVHHLRILWGIGRDKAHEDKAKEMDVDDEWSATDASESEKEIEDLFREAEEYETDTMDILGEDNEDVNPLTSFSRSKSPTPTPVIFPNNMDDDDDDDEFVGVDDSSVFNISKVELQAIQTSIQDVELPTWVARPPKNLGDANHGKLKAQEYLTLFSVILPLIIPELWHTAAATYTEKQNLQSFYHLVIATNIICSFRTSNTEADIYTDHYIKYRKIIQHIFPYWSSTPNHHWAMHNAAILKYWGPLPALSEFAGEQLIGMLQKIQTNGHQHK